MSGQNDSKTPSSLNPSGLPPAEAFISGYTRPPQVSQRQPVAPDPVPVPYQEQLEDRGLSPEQQSAVLDEWTAGAKKAQEDPKKDIEEKLEAIVADPPKLSSDDLDVIIATGTDQIEETQRRAVDVVTKNRILEMREVIQEQEATAKLHEHLTSVEEELEPISVMDMLRHGYCSQRVPIIQGASAVFITPSEMCEIDVQNAITKYLTVNSYSVPSSDKKSESPSDKKDKDSKPTSQNKTVQPSTTAIQKYAVACNLSVYLDSFSEFDMPYSASMIAAEEDARTRADMIETQTQHILRMASPIFNLLDLALNAFILRVRRTLNNSLFVGGSVKK